MTEEKNISVKYCSVCDKKNKDCSSEEVSKCLTGSECEYCGSDRYCYPYGYHETRHCSLCGAEWSVYK